MIGDRPMNGVVFHCRIISINMVRQRVGVPFAPRLVDGVESCREAVGEKAMWLGMGEVAMGAVRMVRPGFVVAQVGPKRVAGDRVEITVARGVPYIQVIRTSTCPGFAGDVVQSHVPSAVGGCGWKASVVGGRVDLRAAGTT